MDLKLIFLLFVILKIFHTVETAPTNWIYDEYYGGYYPVDVYSQSEILPIDRREYLQNIHYQPIYRYKQTKTKKKKKKLFVLNTWG